MKKHRIKSNFLTILIASIFIITGLLMTAKGFSFSYNNLRSNHIQHLEDMIQYADSQIAFMNAYLEGELRDLDVEFVYNDEQQFREHFHDLDLNNDNHVDILLLISNGEVLFSSADDNLSYNFPYGYYRNRPGLCTDEFGNKYVYMSIPSKTADRDYVALLDIQNYFDMLTSKDTFHDYRYAIYDAKTGICLNNYSSLNGVNISLTLMSCKHDPLVSHGIYMLADSEKDGKKVSGDYTFRSGTGEELNCFTAAMPSSILKNKVFAIGISESSDYFINRLRIVFWLMPVASACLVIGIAIFITLIISKEKRQPDLPVRSMN